MNGYRPDLVGALIAGIAIGLSVFICTRIWPQRDRHTRVTLIAVGIGAALAIVGRTLARRFGI